MTLDFLDRLTPQETIGPMREALRVEDAGWKGAEGTSIVHTPEIYHFFLHHARLLAGWNQLALAILRCGGRAVAFSYGLAAKGVFYSLKVGYDPEFAACSPGQLLRCRLIERLCADPAWRGLDFVGPISEAQAHWRPRTYPVGRLMAAPGGGFRGWPSGPIGIGGRMRRQLSTPEVWHTASAPLAVSRAGGRKPSIPPALVDRRLST